MCAQVRPTMSPETDKEIKVKKPQSAAQIARTVKMRAALMAKVAAGEIKLGARPPSLATLKKRADKDAREKFLAFASTHVLPVGNALVERALSGDTQAIKEFFDRTWGKAPQFISATVGHFSLLDLGKIHEAQAQARILEVPSQVPRIEDVE